MCLIVMCRVETEDKSKPRKLRRKTYDSASGTMSRASTASRLHGPSTATMQAKTLQEGDDQPVPYAAGTRKYRYTMSTTERSIAAKVYFEHYFDRLFSGKSSSPAVSSSRTRRRQQIEQELERLGMSDDEKMKIREEWMTRERVLTRISREKLNIDLFDPIRPLGKGAFGLVQLVREKSTGMVYALKLLQKEAMLRENQESHVRAERDLLSDAASDESCRWLVKLIYSFQDVNNLYFVMEYLPGGDLLSLLIQYDTFPEQMTKFYAAEMVLCIEEAHRLGYVHRDIKPDNFLIDARGHLKLGDCGLATDFHWSHETQYYDVIRKHAYKVSKMGDKVANEAEMSFLDAEKKELDDYITFTQKEAFSQEFPKIDEYSEANFERGHDVNPSDIFCNVPPAHKLLTWRARARVYHPHARTYSVVGTNNYIAPEVLQAQPYDHSCDWWSMGVIIFEMLYGYPPFASKTREGTKQKIMEHSKWLKFPSYVTNMKTQQFSYAGEVSREARDLIRNLVTAQTQRLGSLKGEEYNLNSVISYIINGKDSQEIKKHPWFKDIDFTKIHELPPPWIPVLNSDYDTRYFDQTAAEQGLVGVYATAIGQVRPPAATTEQNMSGIITAKDGNLKDKMLLSFDSNTSDGQDDNNLQSPSVMELRKKLAFVGFTYKGAQGAQNRVESINRGLNQSDPKLRE